MGTDGSTLLEIEFWAKLLQRNSHLEFAHTFSFKIGHNGVVRFVSMFFITRATGETMLISEELYSLPIFITCIVV